MASHAISAGISVDAPPDRVMQALSLVTPAELEQVAAPWLARSVHLAAGCLPGLERDAPLYVTAFTLGCHVSEAVPLRRVVVGRLLPGTRVRIDVAIRLTGGPRIDSLGMDVAFLGRGPFWSTAARSAGWAARGLVRAVAHAWLGAVAARLQATGPSSQPATARASPAACQAPRGASSATSSR